MNHTVLREKSPPAGVPTADGQNLYYSVLVLAFLVCNAAGGFASRLARGLAFTATAFYSAL